ncbi:ARS binding protein 2-domain-containing protein [Phaeosphaeriaceae sp. PMI808]|nr:ARS binding protein 2-domain-containing protein [Phaeosphaeriaceae sp. PMI808]
MHVAFGEDEASQHSLHHTTHYEFRHPAPGVPPIDPDLDQSTTAANRNGHAPMSSHHLLQPADNATHTNTHLTHHGFYGAMSRTSHSPSPNASPRPKQVAVNYAPDDRTPPPRHVTDETIDDAYAAFILYCNPNFATSTDTAELVKLFRTPPKSDGKSFSSWVLFELIRKFDAKEIKTWTQLALDLGVAPPDTDKGQSTQKVQQYSVRLKRWMRAMHIDAFFEYLLGKQHPYYLQIPPLHDPFPPDGRDGVPLEEDLAIRALDPKFKPKRGRRKADEGEDDMDMDDGTPARKRPQLDTSIPFGNALQPQSAYPTSAHPDSMGGFLTPQDPWTAASAITPSSAMTTASAPSRMGQKNLTPYSASPMSGQQIRWRLNTQDNPQTPHPLSAVTPHSAHTFFDEPHSAITPSSAKPRSRRRHGPAVSSAWSSTNSSSTGKLRGRPPSNRSIRDGPFVTFPANPTKREGSAIDINRNPGNLTPIIERAQSDPPAIEHTFRFPPTPASALSPSTLEGSLQGVHQKQRLSLQVPHIVGNPVRLVTPTVLVNGEEDPAPSSEFSPATLIVSAGQNSSASTFHHSSGPTHHTYHGALTPSETPAQPRPPPSTRSPTQHTPSAPVVPLVPLDSLNRALAAELIRAPLSGRRKRLRGTEAKHLASTILQPLYAKPTTGITGPTKILSDEVLGIAISSCLGLTNAVGIGTGGPSGGVKRVDCIRFRIGGDGYESPIDDEDEDAENMHEGGSIKETFDVSFAVSFGGLTGEWMAKGLTAIADDYGDEENAAGGSRSSELDRQDSSQNTPAAWKTKFLEAQRKLWESQEEVKCLKDKILEAVL